MKKYSDNPDDLSLLAEYSTYMDKYDDMVENFDEWEDEIKQWRKDHTGMNKGMWVNPYEIRQNGRAN